MTFVLVTVVPSAVPLNLLTLGITSFPGQAMRLEFQGTAWLRGEGPRGTLVPVPLTPAGLLGAGSAGRLDPELLRQQQARGAWLIPGFPSARAGPAASAPSTPGGPAQAPSRLPAAGPRGPGLQVSPGIPGRAGGGSVRPRQGDLAQKYSFKDGRSSFD